MDMMQVRRQMLMATPHEATASGNPATFDTDGVWPLKLLKVGFEPVQDLHGYDSPWPAGGGKNKFKVDFETHLINGSTVTDAGGGVVTVTGTPTSPFDWVIGTIELSAGDYILTGCPANGGAKKYRLQVTDYPVRNSLGQDNGSGVSFTIAETSMIAVRVQVYTGAPNSLVYYPMIRLASITDATYAPYSNICPITGWTGVNVRHSGEDTSNPDVLSIAFPTEAGTVYGGTLDVVTGELVVDMAMVDFGTLSWNTYSTSYGICFYATPPNSKQRWGGKCSQYVQRTRSFTTLGNCEFTTGSGAGYAMFVRDDAYTDITSFKTAMSGVQLVYQLANPITYHLTPQQVLSLVGENTVWNDTNGGCDVTYWVHER